MVYNALDCAEDDYYALFVLCLLYAMSHNKGKQFLLFPGKNLMRHMAVGRHDLFVIYACLSQKSEKFFTWGAEISMP